MLKYMSKRKNIKHQLEIAVAIMKTSESQLAKEWGYSPTHIAATAKGERNANPARKKIEDFIELAQETVPFQYPKEKVAA